MHVLTLSTALFDYLGSLVVMAVLFADKNEFRVGKGYGLRLFYKVCRLLVRQTFFVGTLATTATLGEQVEIARIVNTFQTPRFIETVIIKVICITVAYLALQRISGDIASFACAVLA